MKVIEFINKINNDKKIPNKIKIYDDIYEYDTNIDDYVSIEDKDYFQDSYNIFEILNDEIEILEEQKENKITPDDIKNIGKTFGTIERLFKSGYEEGLEEPKEELEELEEMEYAKAGDLMITIINELIKNQNKIIRELKVNK